MSAAPSIGIQTIMPKTATSPKDPPQPPANDRAAEADSAPKPAPPQPPPGMGKFVDKTV
ncbi:MAG TPA: hypothetical protein VMI47_00345 [Pseudolabrys sp.]|nr:hypothetical protein [Pseudolabrys sp.]